MRDFITALGLMLLQYC